MKELPKDNGINHGSHHFNLFLKSGQIDKLRDVSRRTECSVAGLFRRMIDFLDPVFCGSISGALVMGIHATTTSGSVCLGGKF